MKLSSLIGLVNGLKLINDCEFNALGMATSTYKNKRVLTFLTDLKYLTPAIKNTSIKGIVCNEETFNTGKIPNNLGILLSEKPREAFFNIHNELSDTDFYWSKFENKISTSTYISKNAIIGEHSVKVGKNCIIEPGVIIHPGSIIGNDVIIRSGSQIGSNGFQFINDGNAVFSVKTSGRIIINDNVEIQHNCCLDRGVLGGDTELGKYVKLDNFVHVAHDVMIGDRTFVTAGVKFAGRVTVGKDCWIGVNATISNGITIGDKCRISLGAVVTKNVESYSTVTGNFAIEHKKFIEFIKTIR